MRYNESMKIGIDIRNIGKNRTGDEVVFLNMVRELLKIDRENEYLLFLDARTDDELNLLRARLGMTDGCRAGFVLLPARNKFDWNLWWVPRYLRAHAVDVYHTQYIVPFFTPRRTHIVTHIHDVSFRVYPQYLSPTDRFFLNLLIPRSLRRADAIIAPSEFTKREILRCYPVAEEKVSVAYNAVAPEFFQTETLSETAQRERTDEIRKKYHLPETYLLSVGTLQPRKNLPFLIELFSRLRKEKEGANLGLVLVGNREGHHVDRRIDETIERLRIGNSVVFPGFVDQSDLPILMRNATLFVFPSRYEGFGIPLLEAMSQGVPVAASDTPALREAGGDAALFFPTDDADRGVETLRTACFSPSVRATLRERGYIRSKQFSWESAARSLLVTYEKICFHKGVDFGVPSKL